MLVPRLPRALLVVYGTTLADTLGYTLMIPLLSVVAKEYGAPDTILGSLLSIPAVCSTLAAPVWGKLSDRIGRKTVIVTAQFLSLAGYLLLAFSHSLLLVFVSRVISGLGGGSLGSVEAFIADVTSVEDRDAAYAMYGAVFGLGFIVGPVMAGALISHGIGFPFLLAAALELANIVFTLRFLSIRRQTLSHTSFFDSLRALSKPGIKGLLECHFLFILAVVCFLANFELYLERVLHAGVVASSWLLASAGAIGGFALLLLITPPVKALGERRIAQLGLTLSIGAYALLFAVNRLSVFWVVLVIWATGSALTLPALTTLLSEYVEALERGAIMGLTDSLYSLAMIVGPSAGSAIIAGNPRLLGTLPLFAAIAAWFVFARSPQPKAASPPPA